MASKERKALGTGLGVLFGGDDLSDETGELSTVPISKIEPRIEQPREYFNEEALQTLADSIKRYGLIQPITVRKIESGFYQIIAGERRWRASKIAGISEVPVRIIDADDKTTAELALVENLQREDLNPVEEAKGYKSLIDEFGLTQEDVAASVGKSRPAIANSMRLLNLSEKVLSLVEKGDLSAGHARAIVSVSDADRQLAIANEIISKNLSVRKAEQLSAKYQKETDNSREENISAGRETISIDYAKEISEELSKILGRKVSLIEGKKTGKIEIEFYDDNDREILISKLKKL